MHDEAICWRPASGSVCSQHTHPAEDPRRSAPLMCCALVALAVTACAKGEQAADTTTPAATPATPPAPPPLNLADVAGTWTVTGKNAANDSTLVTYEMKATADTTGWTITFPNRRPIPMRVVGVSGDSVMVEAGPYPSAVRRGVNVSTKGVFRLQEGRIVGLTTARYDTRTADSVVMVRSEGTRKP